MPSSLSKHVHVRQGLHEYTATASLASSGTYLEVEFSQAVQLCQVAWEAGETHTGFRLWLIDSMGLMQNLLDSAGSPYAMNIATGGEPPRQFDLPAGGKLRLELVSTSGDGMIFLSCLAQRT